MAKRLMERVRRFLATVPTTNLRITVHIALSAVYVIGTMVAAPLDALPPLTYHTSLGGYLLIAMGIDTVQFTKKRRTWRPESPQEKEAEA